MQSDDAGDGAHEAGAITADEGEDEMSGQLSDKLREKRTRCNPPERSPS